MNSTDSAEKRHAKRHECIANVKWSYTGQSFVNDGRILNFNDRGVYLETNVSPKPGTTVWYRVDQRLSECCKAEVSDFLHTIAIVDTKWTRELSDTSGQVYGVGFKYQFRRSY